MSDEISLEIITSLSTAYSIDDLCRLAGKDSDWITALLDYEIIVSDLDGNKFSYHRLDITFKALRLQNDLELNIAGIALALQLIDEIDRQRQKIEKLRRIQSGIEL